MPNTGEESMAQCARAAADSQAEAEIHLYSTFTYTGNGTPIYLSS